MIIHILFKRVYITRFFLIKNCEINTLNKHFNLKFILYFGIITVELVRISKILRAV